MTFASTPSSTEVLGHFSAFLRKFEAAACSKDCSEWFRVYLYSIISADRADAILLRAERPL